MSGFDTLLVANRGEIALRVMRTARRLGLNTVAVYSDADATAPHVRFADAAVHIGASPAAQSYLRGEAIIEAAQAAGAGAIHPGYGFLSENAAFASAVEVAGLVFVGPPAEAVEIMGDKARAKRAMIEAGVPCVPGYQGDDQSDGALLKEAKAIGFPLMVKAAAGGGGRGMRLVETASALPDALKLARSEAENAFGSGELILEQAIARPRHVEIQVFADAHGGIVHLGERDCSVQRRHQKVIEEAPSPALTPDLRAAMGEAAVAAARAVNYLGAGTVEFLLDEAGAFYFLEMNTRLQVEHPVTEAITGFDLVDLQLQVARGQPLGFTQEEVALCGHAIEVRLCAEDPQADFLPSTGPVLLWQPPLGEGIRVDAGLETGGEVSPFYDPMVAKIIAHGPTREAARRRLVRALEATACFGPKTNRDFLIDALGREAFIAGEATTAFIGETYGGEGFAPDTPKIRDYAAAAVLQHVLAQRRAMGEALDVACELLDWSSAGELESVVEYEIGGVRQTLDVYAGGGGRYRAGPPGETVPVELREIGAKTARLAVDGEPLVVVFAEAPGGTLHLATPTHSFAVTDLSRSQLAGEAAAGGGHVTAPMHGRLLELFVSEGQRVVRGERLGVLEAMKMQHELVAEVEGRVCAILALPDSQVGGGDLILEIETDGD